MRRIFEKTRITNGILAVLFTAAFVFGVLALRPVNAAGSATITLSPSSGTYTTGSTIAVTITFNGSDMYGGQADLSYDQSKLEYLSIDNGSSAFAQAYPSSGGSGSVSIARTVQGTPVSGSRVFSRVNFKMLASSGTATVSVKDSSTIYDSNVSDIWNHSLASATFTAASASSGGGGGGGGSNSGGSSGGGSSTPGGSWTNNGGGSGSGGSSSPAPSDPGGSNNDPGDGAPAAPAPSLNIKSPGHDSVEYTKAKISGVLDKPAKVRVMYSLTLDGKTLDFVTPEVHANGKFSLALDPTVLIPGTTYTYQIIANDGAAEVRSEPQTFTTLGYEVSVAIKDKAGKAAKNTEVTLHSEPQTVKTDGEGIASFQNVAPGEHRVEVKSGGKVLSATINVADNVAEIDGRQVADPQDFAVTLDGNLSNGILYYATLGSGIAVALAVLIGGFIVLRNRFGNNFFKSAGSYAGGQSAGVGPAVTSEQQSTGSTPGPLTTSKTETISSLEDRLARLQGSSNVSGNPGQVIAPQTQDKDDPK